ncbi:MAG TPA: shikimate kinase [Chloroflexia bacterium]|nr:shikimate kinase [Chloroflexia bacterium]
MTNPRRVTPNLILAGFMGTGKSSVAACIAGWTGHHVLDFDAALAAQFGKPIARIFAEEGERAFRAAEAALCRSIPLGAGWIVAVGGGAVVDPGNRAALAERGVLVCLTADPVELVARLTAPEAGTRPLLGTDPEAAVRALLAARAPAYAAIPLQVDTTGLDVHAVAGRVLVLYESTLMPPTQGESRSADAS